MNPPLVSVICLCYNHQQFVEESIQSVLGQTYTNIQLIVVDDQSTDQSADVVRRVLATYPAVEFVALPANLGNCRAFNRGFANAKGDFIIDLSADDVLTPHRIENGVKALEAGGVEVGVNFTDAQLIDENGNPIGLHSDRFPHERVPQGDVYKEVLSHYFINSPTMMMRRAVFEKLGGYDESLAYEDFDFWVRSSRYFRFSYSPEPLVKRRILSSSLGRGQYKKGSGQLRSTLRVCEKAFNLNRTPDENSVLKKRIRYEIRRALSLGEFNIAMDYWKLLRAH